MSPMSYQTAPPRDIKLVPETGVEPARDSSHGILSPGRLPIPPLRPADVFIILTQTTLPVKPFFEATNIRPCLKNKYCTKQVAVRK